MRDGFGPPFVDERGPKGRAPKMGPAIFGISPGLGTADARLSSRTPRGGLDHLIAGCVSPRRPNFLHFSQPNVLPPEGTVKSPRVGPIRMATFTQATRGGLVGVAVTLWQRCPWSSL